MEEKSNMKALVIGYGSIGKRHARLLNDLSCRVAVLSRRPIEFSPHYFDLSQALDNWQPEYVVVANRTNEHLQTIETLSKQGFKGRLLIEKPLFDQFMPFPENKFSLVAVAYNLRHHRMMRKLKNLLNEATELISVSVYVGSYLPDWRTESDYRHSYSARKQEGGGVLRDLSHELDYVLWLFGPWRWMTAAGGHLSSLEIDSDDIFSLLLATDRCPLVSIHMNYLDRMPCRKILVNTNNDTICVDLIKNIFHINGIQETVCVGRDDTYVIQHQAMLNGNLDGLCTIGEAIETLNTIDVAEKSAMSHKWIER